MANLGLPPVYSPRPGSGYSNFDLHSRASSASGDEDDEAPLPFPTALSRRDFVAPNFDAVEYLSALHSGPVSRHQTLEDLRSELRERSSGISAELLELVNSNYTSFLSLGDELKGGEERVEDVRVALLGFRRAVEEVQSRVRDRKLEVQKGMEELGEIRSVAEMGRKMLELDERTADLEGRLALKSLGKTQKEKEALQSDWIAIEASDEDEDEEDEDDEGGISFVGSSPAKLDRLARDYVAIQRLANSIGRDIPFVQKAYERIARCRNTILLDLGTALKGARNTGQRGQSRILKYLAVYRALDATAEALLVLREKDR